MPTDAVAQEDKKIGEVLLGRYRIEARLGSGPFATVYKAADLDLSLAHVALKQIHPHLLSQPAVHRKLQAAVLEMRQLIHPNIRRSFDLEEDEHGRLYLVSEFIDGWSLAQLMDRQAGKALRATAAIRVLRASAEALRYAHERGVLHLDLKPENILINSEGEVKVADFGFANAFEELDGFTATGEAIADPAYMAPEQFQLKEVGPETDFYSWAAIGYHLCNGHSILEGKNYLQCARTHIAGELSALFQTLDVPTGLLELFERCAHSERSGRPQSAEELVTLLDDLDQLDSQQERALRRMLSPRERKYVRNRWMAFFAVIMAVFVTTIALWAFQDAPRRMMTHTYLRLEKALGVDLHLFKRALNIDYSLLDPYALHKAIRAEDLFALEILLRSEELVVPEPLKQIDEQGFTPVHLIVKHMQPEIHTLSHATDAWNIDAVDSAGNTALHYAILTRKDTAAMQLLTLRASPDKVNRDGLTPLHLAIQLDQLEVIMQLLSHEASPYQRTPDGRTLPMWAIDHFKVGEQLLGLLQALVLRGAPMIAYDNAGRSTLDYAEDIGVPEIQNFVLERWREEAAKLRPESGEASQ